MPTVTLTDQMRKLIAKSKYSRYQLWQATGIDQATLSRFMSGKGGLSSENLDKLADFLGWTISTKQKGK